MALVDKLFEIMDRESNEQAADELRHGETSQPTSIVPGFISPGLTVLVAKPKMGMPILGLGLAMEVARGGKVFGTEIKAREVLYLAPKTSEPRLRERLKKMLQGADCPVGLEMVFKSMHLDGPGFEELEALIAAHPEIQLVFIEMYRSRKQRPEDAGHAQFARLKAIAIKHQIALVVVHHPRQGGLADYFAPDSGSRGLIGAIDTIATLDRQPYQRRTTLCIAGRNHKTLELARNKTTGGWEGPSPGKERRRSQARQEIVAFFREKPGLWRQQDIMLALGKNKTAVANLLAKLVKEEILGRARHGLYYLSDGSPESWPAAAMPSLGARRKWTVAELDALLAEKIAKILKQSKDL